MAGAAQRSAGRRRRCLASPPLFSLSLLLVPAASKNQNRTMKRRCALEKKSRGTKGLGMPRSKPDFKVWLVGTEPKVAIPSQVLLPVWNVLLVFAIKWYSRFGKKCSRRSHTLFAKWVQRVWNVSWLFLSWTHNCKDPSKISRLICRLIIIIKNVSSTENTRETMQTRLLGSL